MVWDEERWARSEPSTRNGRVRTAGGYLLASAALFAAAIAAAIHRIEFDDTGTSVVNGLHRYLTMPGATALQLALVAVVLFLLASAACSVLAVAALRDDAAGLQWIVVVAAAAVVGLLVVLWFIAPPAFSSKSLGSSIGLRVGAPASAIRSS